MELNLYLYRIYSNPYEFLKFTLILELDLNNSKDEREMPLLQWAEPTEALGRARLWGLAHLALSAHGQNRGSGLPQWLVRPGQGRALEGFGV
jgi:hypothetical protein